MTIFTLSALLLVPARAQTAPAPTEGPAPVEAIRPSNVDELFRQFNSGRPMLPTLKEVRAQQLKRDLAPLKGSGDAEGLPGRSDFAHFNQTPPPGVRRDFAESVDVAMSRPARRVELGAGYSEEDVYEGNRHLSSVASRYGFVRFDLSKTPLARKLFHSPTAVHSETETQDDHAHVSKDEYTVDFLKHPH